MKIKMIIKMEIKRQKIYEMKVETEMEIKIKNK